jgi:polysaccharide biosynthesis protein PelA
VPNNQSQRVLLWLVFVLVTLSQAAKSPASLESFAFFYGSEPPLEELRAFDRVVLEPDHALPTTWALASSDSGEQARWVAYVALGEVHPSRGYFQKIPKEWRLGMNTAWGSVVLDQTADAWPDFFLLQVITPLWKKGFRGFFLDALDSYELFVKSPEERERQIAGQIAVIQRIKKAYPSASIMLNRGFPLLPSLPGLVDAVVFESLFRGWDASKNQFTEVNEPDRFYLLDKAQTIRKTYGIPVISIDYVPEKDRDTMRATAERIRNLGLIPWVTTPSLNHLGVGSIEVQPRKILMLYDGHDGIELDELAIHRYVDPIVTHLGYVPEHRDIRKPPPAHSLLGQYAGIICWLAPGRDPVSATMNAWLAGQAANGIKIVFWGEPPFTSKSPAAKGFGMKMDRPDGKDTLIHIVTMDSVMRFEMEPYPDARAFRPLRINAGNALLKLANARGDTMVAAAYMPWGGFVLAPFLVRTVPLQKRDRWVVQPMDFLAKALQLPVLPAPDITSENGLRLLLIHVDGDGFANKAEWVPNPYSGEVLEKEVFTKYPFATTFSVIEGEVAPHGMYPEHSPYLIPIAKRILAMPHIEIASHSFSHPFNWKKFSQGGPSAYPNHLNIKGFKITPKMMEREIIGSIDYINRELAPAEKTCKVFLWTGYCNPDSRTVGIAYAAGVANMNGGETLISASSGSWTGIAPIGIQKGNHYQVYAPIQNENMYTNEWRGPFYGFENVIKTFEQTDKPIRFKPVDIYYHSYSGSKQASLQALLKVYDWASRQELHNVFVSEYASKVLDFTRMSVARSGSSWILQGDGALKQVRLPSALGYPDLKKSTGVAGFADVGEVRYIHLTGPRTQLTLSSTPPDRPYLVHANGVLQNWISETNGCQFQLSGHQKLKFTLGHVSSCRVLADGVPLQGKANGAHSFAYQMQTTQATIHVNCP